MDEATVTEILDDRAKFGTSAKTNKEWSMSRVGLNNGESTFIFNPIEIGDVVTLVVNGEYKNWQKKKVDPKHEEIMKALREIYKAITGEFPEKATEPVMEFKSAPESPKKAVDKVYDVDTEKPVVIPDDGIPF